ASTTLNGVCPRPVPTGLDQPQGLVYSPLSAAWPTANTRSLPPATSDQAWLKLPVTSPLRSARRWATCTASAMLALSAAYSLPGTGVGSEWFGWTTLTSSCDSVSACPSAVAVIVTSCRFGAAGELAVTVSVTVFCLPGSTDTFPWSGLIVRPAGACICQLTWEPPDGVCDVPPTASCTLTAVPGYTSVMPGRASTNEAVDPAVEIGPATCPSMTSPSMCPLAPPQVWVCGPLYWWSRS